MVRAWKHMFNLYEEEEPPSWEAFIGEYAEDAPEIEQLQLDPLDAEDVYEAFKRRPAHKAGGFDGWRSRE
eukprot:8584198-Alexandrium_andersonii.AAC.1